MDEIEAHLIKVILLHGGFCQPVSCAEGLQLVNSIIEGTVSQVQLIQWKIIHLGKNYNEEAAGQLGQKYWRNFCAHYEREIESKKAVQYESKRDDWCTVYNFESMHDDIYDTMAKAGVAKELDDWA
jgi:hypothetical protein